jgi:hypothetical protein
MVAILMFSLFAILNYLVSSYFNCFWNRSADDSLFCKAARLPASSNHFPIAIFGGSPGIHQKCLYYSIS